MEKANNGNELPVMFLTSSFMNYETDEDYELTGGEKEFKVKTFIVYQFEFI